jgi:hypothetical protein
MTVATDAFLAAPEVRPPDPRERELRRATVGYWLLVALIAIVGVGKAVRSDVMDPDSFWHVKVAEQLQRGGIHPIVDHLSYMSIKEPWTPYSWLAELAMKWTWDVGGYRLSLVFRAAMVALTVICAALACATFAGKERRMSSLIAVVFFAYLSMPFLSWRPATLAILLMALCAWLLLRDRRLSERSRAVWWIVPATALMVNVHLTAIVIPMWVAALLAGGAWEHYRGATDETRRRIRRYAVLLIATALACLATPLLPGVIRTAWHYQAEDVMVASDIISEMRPVWKSDLWFVTVPLLVLFFVNAYRHREALRAGEWLWLIVGTVLLLRLGRFAPLFAMIAAPVLAATLTRRIGDRVLARPIVHVAVCISLLTFVTHVIRDFPKRGGEAAFCEWLNTAPRHFYYPCAAADWVEANLKPRTGRLINEFNWGGFLAWRLGAPRSGYQTLLDGRTQMFTPAFWRKTMLAPDDATRMEFFKTLDADVAILPVQKSRFRNAVEQMGWVRIYRDDRGIADVYVPPEVAKAPTP